MSKPQYLNYGLTLKKQVLNEAHNASLAHTRLVRRIEHLVENLPVDIKTIPMDFSHSEFSQWFASRSMKFKKIPQLRDYVTKIEYLTHQLEVMYENIYLIYAQKKARQWFRPLLTLAYQRVSSTQHGYAQHTFENFTTLSDELIEVLNKLENHLAIQPNENLLILL